MARTMLSTTDNPYNPFTQYNAWASYDEVVCGYYSAAYVGRIVSLSPELGPREMDQAIEDAIDEICEMDLRPISPLTGKEVAYIKVREDVDDRASVTNDVDTSDDDAAVVGHADTTAAHDAIIA